MARQSFVLGTTLWPSFFRLNFYLKPFATIIILNVVVYVLNTILRPFKCRVKYKIIIKFCDLLFGANYQFWDTGVHTHLNPFLEANNLFIHEFCLFFFGKRWCKQSQAQTFSKGVTVSDFFPEDFLTIFRTGLCMIHWITFKNELILFFIEFF